MADETIGMTIRMSPAERDALREIAAKQERSMQGVVRRLIRQYIKAESGATRARPGA